MKKKKRLVREQLEATLRKFRPLLDTSMPPKGWIRAIRDALAMNGRQFADRLNVTRQGSAETEKNELAGSATLETMRRAAECLDCIFVYALVPRTNLEQTVRNQAMRVAQNRLSRASHTMKLESQELTSDEQEKALADMIEELVDSLPSTFWDQL